MIVAVTKDTLQLRDFQQRVHTTYKRLWTDNVYRQIHQGVALFCNRMFPYFICKDYRQRDSPLLLFLARIHNEQTNLGGPPGSL